MPGGGRGAEAVAGGGPPLPVEPGPEVPFEKVEPLVPVGVDLIQHWKRGGPKQTRAKWLGRICNCAVRAKIKRGTTKPDSLSYKEIFLGEKTARKTSSLNRLSFS